MPENEDRNVPEKDVPESEENATLENEENVTPESDDEAVPAKGKRRFGWKSILLAIAALALVGSLLQGLIRGGGFGGALDTTGDNPAPKKSVTQEELKKPKKPTTVELGNKKIPQAAGAIIVINPGLVTPGGKASVEGAGFDAKATVDLMLKTGKSGSKGESLASVKADRTGNINAQFSLPENISGTSATVVAQQRGSDNVAEAQVITGGGIGAVKINKAAGKPGDSVSLSIRGFGPGEPIDVYWGRVSGTPMTTLQADGSGGIGRADIKVGVTPTGSSTLVLVGRKTKTTATAPFEMLGLYPTLKSSPYALKSGERLALSASGFAPDERVLVYINAAGGVPTFTTQSDANGNVGNVSFDVPFGLKGEQSLTAIGERTRAVVRAGFQVLPYTPTAEPSTFGGKAGTTLSFYVSGFAANENVTIYAGVTEGSAGKKVSTFKVNDKGEAEAAGSYKITKEDEGGVAFKLVGDKSEATAEAGVNAAQEDQGTQQQGEGK